MVGAAFGRSVGIGMTALFPSLHIHISTYAILGAAAVTGGITRLTISLTVLLVESTDYAYLALPVMLVVMIARWTAGLFVGGLYSNYIALYGIPFLDWSPPRDVRNLRARDIMNKPPVCFFPSEKVGDVLQKLEEVTHNGFPVVNSQGQLLGLILRSQLTVLMKNRAFLTSAQIKGKAEAPPPLERRIFIEAYPRYPTVRSLSLTQNEQRLWLDLRPYMNLNPIRVVQTCPMPRVYRVFRTMGLRHLIVVDARNVVKGVITRKNLSKVSTLHKWNKEWLSLQKHQELKHEKTDFFVNEAGKRNQTFYSDESDEGSEGEMEGDNDQNTKKTEDTLIEDDESDDSTHGSSDSSD